MLRPGILACVSMLHIACVGRVDAGSLESRERDPGDVVAALEAMSVQVEWAAPISTGGGYLSLEFDGCPPARGISNLLGSLPRVSTITIGRACDLDILRGIESPYQLIIDDLRAGGIAGVHHLQSLEHLRIQSDSKVVDVSGLAGHPTLRFLDLVGTGFTGVENLRDLPELGILHVHDPDVRDLRFLGALPELAYLDASDTGVSDLEPVSSAPTLRFLDVQDTRVDDLSALANHPALVSVNVSGTQIRDLAPLAGSTTIVSLSFGRTLVQSLAPLSSISGLRSLRAWCLEVSDVQPLTELTELEVLGLGATRVSDCKPLEGLHSLRTLDLVGTDVRDIDCIRALPVETLGLGGEVTSLEPLRGHSSVRFLFLSSAPPDALDVLLSLPNLTKLHVVEGAFSDAEIVTLKQRLTNTDVYAEAHVPLELTAALDCTVNQ